MKTLLFCTSWAENDDKWRFRYGKWLEHIQRSPIQRSQILLVDDGSPLLPRFDGLAPLDAEALPAQAPGAAVVMARFSGRLGRPSLFDYPGWWRSFAFAADYATRYGFDKVLHVESDAFILSQSLHEYLNALQSGWTVFWCPRWRFPETCIQVICRDQLPSYRAVGAKPYAPLAGLPVEKILPFTHVESRFKGDRYGEYRSELPLDADYSSQVPWSTSVWSGTPPPPKRAISLSLGQVPVQLHPALFPLDAWEPVATCAARHATELIDALDKFPQACADAIQFTVLSPVPGDPTSLIRAMRRVLGTGGELLINLRALPGRQVAEALARQLLQLGFADAGMHGSVAGGIWIIASSDGVVLPQPLIKDRFSLRLRLAAECS